MIEEREYQERRAPGALERLRMLLNSDNRFYGFDHFDSPSDLHSFLLANEIIAPSEALDVPGIRRLRVFRDAVRAFLERPSPQTIDALNALSIAHPLVLRLGPGGDSPRLVAHRPRDCADEVIASKLSSVHDALQDGRWARLHVCERPDCQWVYYDSSRNRSARWCSSDPCGDVMKARAWRERQKAAAPTA